MLGRTRETCSSGLQGTYEETLINTANQKSGLNEAILGNINDGGNPEDNAKRIARLLREGANSIIDEAAAAEKAAQFEGQEIEDILAKRTSKRNVASKAGSTFSVASFRAEGERPKNDASFWQDLLPEAVKAHQVAEANKHLVHGPRVRKRVNYSEPASVREKDEARFHLLRCSCSLPHSQHAVRCRQLVPSSSSLPHELDHAVSRLSGLFVGAASQEMAGGCPECAALVLVALCTVEQVALCAGCPGGRQVEYSSFVGPVFRMRHPTIGIFLDLPPATGWPGN